MLGNKIVLDTNAYSDWQRGIRWQKAMDSASIVYLPFVVVGELLAGFEYGEKGAENLRIFEPFLQSEFVEVLHSDSETVKVYARLFTMLKKQGNPIPMNDLWIASICVRHHLPLATADEHFHKIDILQTVDRG